MLKRVGGVTIAITIPCNVNICHEMIFVPNRLTGNLPVNGIG